MVFVTTLQGTALPVTKESSAVTENEALPDADRLFDVDGGRMLRRAEKHASNEVGVDEERICTRVKQLFNQAIYAAKVKSNGKDAAYYAALLARLRKEGK
ncbi:hypothetical protein PInf_005205 [Phytophthora infestans]|nr:hypothetical protein PInf_005205 [Phytophthora infestans]